MLVIFSQSLGLSWNMKLFVPMYIARMTKSCSIESWQKMRPIEERRAVEALAQTLSEAANPAGIVRMERAQIVRVPWIQRARRQPRQ